MVPIPGTKRRRYLDENAGAAEVKLSPEVVQRLNSEFPPDAAVGERYAPNVMHMVNR